MPTLDIRTNYEIMGSFLQADTGSFYEDNIPELTRTNTSEVGNAILNYQAAKEAFYDMLINKITLQLFNRFLGNNKFKQLKGMMVNGDIEDTYIDYAQGRNFDPDNENPFEVTKSTIKTLYHKRDRELTYTVTVSDFQIRRAFLSEGGLSSFIAQCVDSLYQSAELDEYTMVKEMIKYNYGHAGKVVALEGSSHEEVVRNLLYELKKAGKDLTYASREHNEMEVMNSTPKDNQVIVLHKDYALDIDTGILANAYNMDKLRFDSQVIEIDNFNEDTDHIVAVILDQRGFRLHDVVRTVEGIRNPANLSTTYWFHLWQIVSYAYFMNAIYFVEPVIVEEDEDMPQSITLTLSSTGVLTTPTVNELALLKQIYDLGLHAVTHSYDLVTVKKDTVAITGLDGVAMTYLNAEFTAGSGKLSLKETALVLNTVTDEAEHTFEFIFSKS